MPLPAPTPGQIVRVRARLWVVRASTPSTPPTPPLHAPPARTEHLVHLASIEEDGLGEELRVLWEIEPGVAHIEGARLPTPTLPLDDPTRLDAFLDAVRWGIVSPDDDRDLQAPFRAGISVEDYQLDPVSRALRMPRVNLLLADDVGLGKTIEAGMVVRELMRRRRARKVLVLCPASLQLQWKEQMWDKFGLEFRIVDSTLVRELRRTQGPTANPWTHFPRLIASLDWFKRPGPLGSFRATLPAGDERRYPRRHDVLILDEAHNVAPQGRGKVAVSSQRTRALAEITPHFEHKLFLTATPHNGYPDSFSALLALLDDQRFSPGVRPDKAQLDAVMVRRLKRDLPPDEHGRARFPQRLLEALPVPYTDEERRVHHALQELQRLRRHRAQGAQARVATEFVGKLLKKRLFSSPRAFAKTLLRHLETLEKPPPPAPPTKDPVGLLRRRIEDLPEDPDDEAEWELQTEEVLDDASAALHASDLPADEQAILDELRTYARTNADRPDSKAEVFLAWLARTVRPDTAWTDTRVIVFTEYRDTQRWLHDLLADQGYVQGERVMLLHGGLIRDERARVKAAFQASPQDAEVRILLATDAASEGLDLQNHCSRMLHYEIPWNPNRLEQRNGRIDRHGQRAEAVHVFHFAGSGTPGPRTAGANANQLEDDLEFLLRVARKVDTIREDLGRVGTVLARHITAAMIGEAPCELPELETTTDPTTQLLSFDHDLARRLEELREQLRATAEHLALTPERIRSVVAVGLDLAHHPPLQPATAPGLPPGSAWELPRLPSTWAACAEGLPHPHTGRIRPLVFDPELARGRDDVVLCHLEHRLAQMCLRLLREQVFSPEGAGLLARVTARTAPGLEGPTVLAYARLVVLGAEGDRLHEELLTAGGLLHPDGTWRRQIEGVGELERLGAQGGPTPADASRTEALVQAWESQREPLLRSLKARESSRTRTLESRMEESCRTEVARVQAVLGELKQRIQTELGHDRFGLQQTLFADTAAEVEELRRTKEILLARLASLPDEIEREVEALKRRFATPTPKLFPVAVTYLVPG